MGKNIAIKEVQRGFLPCQNHTVQWDSTSNKEFQPCNRVLNQCFNVLVKPVVGPCRNVPLFLWRVGVQLCKKKLYFN